MSRAVEALLAGAERMALGDGRFLRLLSAQETLEARREGEALARTGREKALCNNAALLARALEGPEGPLFSHAQAVLEGMTAREIGETLGLKTSAVTTRLSRGRELLKAKLTEGKGNG